MKHVQQPGKIAPVPGGTAHFPRSTSNPNHGLTQEEVRLRKKAGAHNVPPRGATPSVGKILLRNICTLFNLINIVLAAAILLVGKPWNILFLGVALSNTAMGIFQELSAKRKLDHLSVLAHGKAEVVRDGEVTAVEQGDVVLDDVLVLRAGRQAGICRRHSAGDRRP